MLLKYKPHVVQPDYPVTAGASFGLRQELLYIPGQPSDTTNGKFWTLGSSITQGTAAFGRQAGFPGGTYTAAKVITRTGGSQAAQTKVTFVWAGYYTATGSFPTLISCKLSNTGQGLYLADVNPTAGSVAVVKGGVVALNAITIPSGSYVIVASHNQSSGEYYIIAKNLDTGTFYRATQTNTQVSTAGNGTYCIGSSRLDTSVHFGNVALAFVAFDWMHEVSARRLLDNPWELIDDTRLDWAPAVGAGGGGGTTYNQAISGVITTSGIVGYTITFSKGISGILTPSGVTSKQTTKVFASDITAAGVIVKLTNKRAEGSITGVGVGSGSTGATQALQGSITASGAISLAVSYLRSYASSLTLTGALNKLTLRSLSGSITAVGVAVKQMYVRVTGSLTASGTLSSFKFTPTISSIVSTTLRSIRRFIGRR